MSAILTWFIIAALLIIGWMWYELAHAERYESDPGHPFIPGKYNDEHCDYWYEVGAASGYCDRPKRVHRHG